MTTRRMSRALQDAIDCLPGDKRDRLIAALGTPVNDPDLAQLLTAVQLELIATGFREQSTLAALEADHQAEVERIAAELLGPDPQRTDRLVVDDDPNTPRLEP